VISPGAVFHVPSTIMHSNLRRLPAERARHRKRLPSQGREDAPPLARQVLNNDGFTLTGPITVTQVIPINPATTTSTTNTNLLTTSAVQATVTTSASTTSVPTSSVSTASAAPPTLTPVTPPVPVASAINPSASTSNAATENAANSNGGVAGVSTQHGLPTGAIVGITIACVMLILGAFVFFIRQRAMRNRKQARQSMAAWQASRPTNSSFEPRPVAQFPASMGETSPGISFARAQAQALAARAPVPDMPQPMASSYNNPVPAVPVVPTGSAASATVLYEFIPTLPDELSITTGEIVRVVSEYDDGWALCANARGEQGMVPLECLDRGSPPTLSVEQQQDYRDSRRTSSLGVRN